MLPAGLRSGLADFRRLGKVLYQTRRLNLSMRAPDSWLAALDAHEMQSAGTGQQSRSKPANSTNADSTSIAKTCNPKCLHPFPSTLLLGIKTPNLAKPSPTPNK